ncbi:MAG: CoA transferase, partial [Myxococcota bacterium]
MQALDDLVVLDLTQHIAGPYATRLLADLGADVIKVEPPEGDVARQLGPYPGDAPHPEKSGLFFYLNCNKRSVVLDLATAAGRRDLLALAARANLVVESFAPGTLDRLGLGWQELRGLRSDLSLLSISSFGQDGPYRDHKLTELVLYGFAGEMYSMGAPDREPVKMAGTAALFESGSACATAALATLLSSRRHGIGQHVDVSLAETHLGGCDRRHATAIAYQFSGRRTARSVEGRLGLPGGIYRCADGYVDFTAAGIRPDRVVDLLRGADWLADPRFGDSDELLKPETIAAWNSHFGSWCMARTKREIWAEARRAKVLCGPLFAMQDLFEDEHFRARGFWVSIEHPELGRVTLPGRPFALERAGWQLRRPAPLLGQHTAEVLDELSRSPAHAPAPPRPAARRSSGERPRPLEGVRVIDLCVVWAGPFATMLLGDLGAEVIKPENQFVWQPMTRGGSARPDKGMLQYTNAWGGGYPRNEPGARPWNYSPTFVSLYRNKKSFTVDLRQPEGLDVLARLVALSDVVYENNATGTLEKLGISYDWLREANPSIIFVQVPAYGSSGAYADARALGVHLEGVMGHTLLRGYEDADPSTNSAIFSGDYLAGTQGALAVMAALRHRDRSGEGQRIEIAQAENAAGMFTQAIMDYSLNGRV